MQTKLRNKIALIAFILFLLTVFAPRLFAAEYSHIYKIEEPKIITLSNGRQILQMEGLWQKDDIVGAPILPVKTSKIFIPANEKVISIEIGYGALNTIEGSYLIQHGTTPYPISYKGPIPVDKPAPDIYETNALYPSAMHRARSPQFLCGAKIVLVDLMPVLYNPVEGQLKYYNELEVKIRTEKQKKPDWVLPFRNFPNDRKKILRTIENKNDFLRLHPGSEQGEAAGASSMVAEPSPMEGERQYVVITTAGLKTAFQTLTEYRASPAGGGYTTHIEDISNIDMNPNYYGVDLAEKIRNFIKDMYTNYGTQYVVLGGDCDGEPGEHIIPTRGCYARINTTTDDNIPSDLYFGCLDGTWNGDGDAIWGESNDGDGGGDIDWESEVYVGRIPADDPVEAQNQIHKIITFEAGIRPNKTLLAGEKLDNEPTWGGDRMDWIYSYMGSTPKTELYDRDWAGNDWPKDQLLTYINSDEHHWINHLGHSNVDYNMKLSNADIASMTNSNYVFIYTQGCYSGSMDNRNSSGGYGSTDCFGEVITNGYNDGGAFAYIGNSRYGWFNPGDYVEGASNRAHKEFVEAIFTDNITKLGEANQKSKTDLDLTSGLYRWIAFETNLLGCPASDLIALACISDADCDDGLYCNGTETCAGGTCQTGTAPECDDGVSCTVVTCNEDTDTCDNVPDDNLCDDGEGCTTDECDPTVGCGNTWPECGLDDGCCGPECTDDPDCTCGDTVCAGAANGEDCFTCPEDCFSGQGGGTCEACFKGTCDGVCHPVKEGPECLDCASSWCCGDGFCEGDETVENCKIDCGCYNTDDCNDGESCTADFCDPETGQCSNTWPACGLEDDCCGPDCTNQNDPNCGSECIENKKKCNCDGECGKFETHESCPWDCP